MTRIHCKGAGCDIEVCTFHRPCDHCDWWIAYNPERTVNIRGIEALNRPDLIRERRLCKVHWDELGTGLPWAGTAAWQIPEA